MPSIVLAMHAAIRVIAAFGTALATRRDLLLEIVALRHQVAVLSRPVRRLRPTDRLLWRCLRRWGRPWRKALVLVQPATVARWRRVGLRSDWRRWNRAPGRPRIDAEVQTLIRRMAVENRLWGAPRVHGELLKLGITVSERTVSRYLADTRRAPSQTWRTFLANHLGQLAVATPIHLSGSTDDNNDVIGARERPPDYVSLSAARPCFGHQRSHVPRSKSRPLHPLTSRVGVLHVHRPRRQHLNAGRDPPEHRRSPSPHAPLSLAPAPSRPRFGTDRWRWTAVWTGP